MGLAVPTLVPAVLERVPPVVASLVPDVVASEVLRGKLRATPADSTLRSARLVRIVPKFFLRVAIAFFAALAAIDANFPIAI